MALVRGSVPSSALGNQNDPEARWSQPQAEPQPHKLVVVKDHELTQFIPEHVQIYSP